MNELKLRSAKLSDKEKTFEWANNPFIRKFSYNNDPIPLDKHLKWFKEKLNSNHCAYYILEIDENAIGSIRFDIENTTAKINYLIDPEFTGKGLGTRILREGIDRLRLEKPFVNIIYGFVIKENLASIKIFENLGFKLVLENDNDLKFEREIK